MADDFFVPTLWVDMLVERDRAWAASRLRQMSIEALYDGVPLDDFEHWEREYADGG